MSIEEAIKYLKDIDSKHKTFEDKNYYLVHGYADIYFDISLEEREKLKDEIFNNFFTKKNLYSSFLDFTILVTESGIIETKNYVECKDEINHISSPYSIMDFYENYDNNLIVFIKGDLFLEYAITIISEKALNLKTEQKTFNEKIELLYSNSIININERKLLKSINGIRNKIAHKIDFKLSFDEIFKILLLSVKCGVVYSDSTIYKNKKLSKEWYGIDGIINELFPNFFCHLIYENEEFFEDSSIYTL